MIEKSESNLHKPSVSVLIVTYNNASTIGQCLDSLKAQTVKDIEIIVRDNASSDSTAQIVQRYPAELIRGEKNIGFGAAMNYLAWQASGEYLFILNPDCLCPPDCLRRLLEFSRDNPGVISPALVYPDGASQVSARELFSYTNIVYSRRSPFYQLGLARAQQAGYLDISRAAKVPAVSATALFIERRLFTEIDGFDERFFMYGEDMDLCKRLANRQIDIWYLPEIKIKHILGASASQAELRSLYYHHVSIYKYFTKHFSRKYIKNAVLLMMLTAGFTVMSILKLLGLKRRK